MSAVRRRVVVVGAGLAGLSAAIRARGSGAEVVVLEGEATLGEGANSRISGGVFHLGWGAMDAPVDELSARVLAETDREIDAGLAHTLAVNARPAIVWLAEQGVVLGPKGARDHDRFTAMPWLPARGLRAVPERGAELMMDRLVTVAWEAGARLRTRARVSSLRWHAGAWQVGTEDGEIHAGDAVILATGGFQADGEMFRQYVGPRHESVFLRSTATSHGDGHRMLAALGAGFTSPSAPVYGHMLSATARSSPEIWPQPTLDALCRSGVLITLAGDTLASDFESGIELVNALVRRPELDEVWVVFDSTSYAGTSAERTADGSAVTRQVDGHLSSVADVVARGAEISEAESLSRLGELLGVGAGSLERAWRDRHGRAQPQGRVYAMPVVVGVTSTLRGACVRPDFSVITAGGAAGVFAVGDLAGLHGGPRGGYLGGLATALISGYVAGGRSALGRVDGARFR